MLTSASSRIPLILMAGYLSDLVSYNGFFNKNAIRHISMACHMEYFTVLREPITQGFIELRDGKVNNIVHTFITHSFNISSA